MCLKIYAAPPILLLAWHWLQNIIYEGIRVQFDSQCHTEGRIDGALLANSSLGITTTKILRHVFPWYSLIALDVWQAVRMYGEIVWGSLMLIGLGASHLLLPGRGWVEILQCFDHFPTLSLKVSVTPWNSRKTFTAPLPYGWHQKLR